MPRLDNQQHEQFCQAWANETPTPGRGVRAARSAGYADNGYLSQTANKLRSRPEIKARIKELEGITSDEESEAERWRDELRALGKKAEGEKQYAPAVRALELVGKSKGFLNETLNLNTAAKIPDEQLAAMVFEIIALSVPSKDTLIQLGLTQETVQKLLAGPKG